MSWELLWKILFIGVLTLFVLMAVLTTIGGARDIKRLLVHLRKRDDVEPDESDSE